MHFRPTTYAIASAYIQTSTNYVNPGAYPNLVSPPQFFDIRGLTDDQFSHFFVKKNKEFKTSIMTSFILLLSKKLFLKIKILNSDFY